jgi:hypothetical protein
MSGPTPKQFKLQKRIAKRNTSPKEHHVRLYDWMTDTEAWRSLGPAPRAVYLELAKRYYGINNGQISLSVREAAALVHINKDTAAACLKELQEKGFIRANQRGHFTWKTGIATTWILTEFDFGNELATKDFARWRPEKEKHGPKPGQNCPKRGTNLFTVKQLLSQFVLRLGLRTPLCTVPRSQIEGHI